MSKKSKSSPQTKSFKKPHDALAHVQALYQSQIKMLRESFQKFESGKLKSSGRVRAFYPSVKISTDARRKTDSRLAYGFVPRGGTYAATLTRPDLFADYYLKQFQLLVNNHGVPLEIGLSNTAIPLHFALPENDHAERRLTAAQIEAFSNVFDIPDPSLMHDEIANGWYVQKPADIAPLSLFAAPRVDLSLQRLRHYTGTSAAHFQNFVIFTNYQFYIDSFIKLCLEMMEPGKNAADKKSREIYSGFIQPGDRTILNANARFKLPPLPDGVTPPRMPQMPAYHLTAPGGQGITMINIGVGPSNAKTITDHLAVLRPHAWLMLGHCAGLRNSQKMGDYVLAHAYLREDNILDEEVPLSIPIPALSEIQLALEKAVSEITGHEGFDVKSVMRTGTVATTADRNWEMNATSTRLKRRLSQSRAIAMDMESGTIAANGFRFRVPYGTLLCVSDKPLHGQLKLPGMADSFYRARVEQHLKIGFLAMEILRNHDPETLHSRKLRSFNEVAFQ